MQKVLFFLSALIAVSAGQQLFNHVVVYVLCFLRLHAWFQEDL